MSTTMLAPATMTVPEAARYLGISRRHAYNAVADGSIPAVRIGRRIVVSTSRLREMVEGDSASPRDGVAAASP